MPAGKGRAEHARLEDFKAQEVSNVAHAFAKLGIYNSDVLEVMSSRHTLYLLQSMGNVMAHGVPAVTCESAIVRATVADMIHKHKSDIVAAASVDAECCTSPKRVCCSLIEMGLCQSKVLPYLVAQ